MPFDRAARVSDFTSRVPMARFATPDGLASAVVFLADSKESSFANEHDPVVDGGWVVDGTWDTQASAQVTNRF